MNRSFRLLDAINFPLDIYERRIVFFSRNSAVDFNFPPRRGTGIARHLSHCSSDTIDIMNQLCVYDPDHRIPAVQALRHPYFDAIR